MQHKNLAMLEKGVIMIYIKDGLTREKFIELLDYSLSEECLYLMAIKPETRIVNDHVYQKESVVKFLKIEEANFTTTSIDSEKSISPRFNLKVLVEDNYWEEPDSINRKEKYILSGIVPWPVHVNVCKILFGW